MIREMGIQEKIPDLDAMPLTEMNQWLASPLGRAILATEAAMLEPLLSRRFGYHLLQLGCGNVALHDSSPIGHKFSISLDSTVEGHSLLAQGEALPIASESVDLVLIHHALDFSDNQHQLLREASRVLIEGGDVIIVGFNPISSWGLRKLLYWPKQLPWQGQSLSTRRLIDWLKLLEFKVEQVNYGFYALPFNSPRLIKYSSLFDTTACKLNWPTGSLYTISAKKEVFPLTPIKKTWREARKHPIVLPIPKNARTSSRVTVSNKEN